VSSLAGSEGNPEDVPEVWNTERIERLSADAVELAAAAYEPVAKGRLRVSDGRDVAALVLHVENVLLPALAVLVAARDTAEAEVKRLHAKLYDTPLGQELTDAEVFGR